MSPPTRLGRSVQGLAGVGARERSEAETQISCRGKLIAATGLRGPMR